MRACICAYLELLDVALDDGLAGFGEVLSEVLPELAPVAGGHAEGGVFPRGDSLVVGTGNQVHSILQAFIRVIKKQHTISVLESAQPDRRLMSFSNS